MSDIIDDTLTMIQELKVGFNKIDRFVISMDVNTKMIDMLKTLNQEVEGRYVTSLHDIPVKVSPSFPADLVKIIYTTKEGVQMSKAVYNLEAPR